MQGFKVLLLLSVLVSSSFGEANCAPRYAVAVKQLISLKQETNLLIKEMEELDKKLDEQTKIVDGLIASALMENAQLSKANAELAKVAAGVGSNSDLSSTIVKQRLVYLKAVTARLQFLLSEENDVSLKEFSRAK